MQTRSVCLEERLAALEARLLANQDDERFASMESRLKDNQASLCQLTSLLGRFVGEGGRGGDADVGSLDRCPRSITDNSRSSYRAKPAKFNGSGSWRLYLTQFLTLAKINNWDNVTKTLALVDSLEGEALTVLSCLEESKRTDFDALVSRLNIQYDNEHLAQVDRFKFFNYRQGKGESLQSMASQICLLSHSAFPDATPEFREKQAVLKFLEAIGDCDFRKDVTLASMNCSCLDETLGIALRVEALRLKHSGSSSQGKVWTDNVQTNNVSPFRSEAPRFRPYGPNLKPFRRQFNVGGSVTCWRCGKAGHISSNCFLNKTIAASENQKGSSTLYKISLFRDVVSDCGVSVVGLLDGRPQKFVIDTGSRVSLLRGTSGEQGRSMIDNVCLRSVTGENVQLFGQRYATVKLGKLNVEQRFLVVDIEEDCILGLDFLSRNKCSVDLGNNLLHFAGVGKVHFDGCSVADVPLENCESNVDEAGDDLEEIVLKNVKENDGPLESPERELPEFLSSTLENNSRHLSQSEKEDFRDFLVSFQDTFAKDDKQLGECKIVKHRIDTGDHAPIKQAPRRVPLQRRDEVRQMIADMESKGVIEKSASSWSSPVVSVKKEDGSTRFCVDYRQLNNITRKDSYPLPRIDDTLDAIAGSFWFSVLDLQSGYWQIEVDERDREKTAFSIGGGLWQFRVMPFGLCNAPATFERLMENVLGELTWRKCLVYLDDIIIFGKTFEEELENLHLVFQKLRQAGLLVAPQKCFFFSD